MTRDEIKKNFVTVIGMGYFITGVISLLKYSRTPLILGLVFSGLCGVFGHTVQDKTKVRCAHGGFSIFFILGYITGCILGIYTFRPEGLIYWYAVGMVCGIAVYLLKNRGLSSTS